MIKTYSAILTSMCDGYDALIAPKVLRRTDTNFIYLIFKALAKGYEVVNNAHVALSNKFNPESCSDADLASVAKLVGTDFRLGNPSGLRVSVTNTSIAAVTLEAGVYIYEYDADVQFTFTVDASIELSPSEVLTLPIAFSSALGSYRVTAMTVLPVARQDEASIDADLVFSCLDNETMLGYGNETTLEFRQRVLSDTTRQNSIKELELEIKNLPYIFDCAIRFNATAFNVTYDGIVIPPFTMLLVLNGDYRPEIAEIVASRTIYPTVVVEANTYVEYEDDIFLNGAYRVYYTTFGSVDYSVHVRYQFNSNIISDAKIQETITAAFLPYQNPSVRTQFITEMIFYDKIRGLNIPSLVLLDVKILDSLGDEAAYIEVPVTRIGNMTAVLFNGD